ncbi:unnamed protein product [Macrosiphum euphorbiae]|uniref:TTF-type domain-containing protein n=1 Tax=Macrosiphum euphorbiae TaxID=13131 RepID=A0AAV0XS00_9HEMI|nr:unnamed protein product [Macrosiphum euphorbiae]
MFSVFNFLNKSISVNNAQLTKELVNEQDDDEYYVGNPSASNTVIKDNSDNLSIENVEIDFNKKDVELEIGDKNTGPLQPILNNYPKTISGNQHRSSSAKYYKDYFWLDYSIKSDAVYCFCCRMYSINDQNEVFVKSGFRNWKKVSFFQQINFN